MQPAQPCQGRGPRWPLLPAPANLSGSLEGGRGRQASRPMCAASRCCRLDPITSATLAVSPAAHMELRGHQPGLCSPCLSGKGVHLRVCSHSHGAWDMGID